MISNKFLNSTGTVAALVLLQGLNLMAHPGHSLFQQGAGHLVTSPFHVACLAVCGGGLFALARLLRNSIARRTVKVLGVAMVAAAFALAGLVS